MTVTEIVFLDEALEDLAIGQQFYNQQQIGVGDYFIDSILSDIDSLFIYAGIHSTHFGYQRLLSKRFPFAIYYDTEQTTARIIAILDMRQHPGSIRSSLLDRESRKL